MKLKIKWRTFICEMSHIINIKNAWTRSDASASNSFSSFCKLSGRLFATYVTQLLQCVFFCCVFPPYSHNDGFFAVALNMYLTLPWISWRMGYSCWIYLFRFFWLLLCYAEQNVISTFFCYWRFLTYFCYLFSHSADLLVCIIHRLHLYTYTNCLLIFAFKCQ